MARRRKRPNGKCHICGQVTDLTYEHVPPASAFNDRPVLRSSIYKQLGIDEHGRDEIQQRGAGGYTLCTACNNDTGAWYGPAYVSFAHQAVHLLQRSGGRLELEYPYWIFPLRVIKQIMAMFCSANTPEFAEGTSYLRKFLLNRECIGLPPDLRVYAAYTLGPRARRTAIMGVGNTSNGEFRTFSEIMYPPFVFVLSIDSAPPDDRLVDLTYMAKYHYNDWGSHFLRLPVLPPGAHIPGDYRSADQLERDRQKNLEDMRRLQDPDTSE